MAILLSDELIRAHNLDEKKLRIEIASFLYDKEILSIGQATRMSGLDRISFQKALSERNIFLKYEEADLLKDLETLKQVRKKDDRNQ